MTEGYEETIGGEVQVRRAPGFEHERLVDRLHLLVGDTLSPNSALQLLPRRSGLRLADDLTVRPDLTVIRMPPSGEGEPAGPQLYLVGEVLQPGDHHLDTVVKKQLWSDLKIPRLWMVDPRYLNVEVYGCGEYGFTLQEILAHGDQLKDPLLSGLGCSMNELFSES